MDDVTKEIVFMILAAIFVIYMAGKLLAWLS